ncbi:glycosyltransferase [Lachnospiraceae bacterium 62-35]
MITISLCMIVRDEEEVLERCLNSVKDLVDEIIIVDTGSLDRTREIAAGYTERIYEIPWKDDFAWARNYSFSKGQKDYCMWLDADDVIDEENRKKFLDLKKRLSKDIDMVMMKYGTSYDDNGNVLFSYYRERLVKNNSGFLWGGRVHEAITPRGKVVYEDIEILHKKVKSGDAGRNLRIYEEMAAQGEKMDPRACFYYGRELYYNRRYKEAEEVLERFLKEPDGWKENKIEACLNLAECYEADKDIGEHILEVLFKSFLLDLPRAEICCKIGDWFQREKRWKEAAYWYERALAVEKKPELGGFIRAECYDYLPEINLCLCYDKMGDYEKAYVHHRKAAALRPSSDEVLWNEAYFQKRMPEKENGDNMI